MADETAARLLYDAPASTRGTEISTRRRSKSGTVHEMADRGIGTLCGRDLPAPWVWTDAPVTCRICERRLTDPERRVVPCTTTTPEPHERGEFPMSCYACHMWADS